MAKGPTDGASRPFNDVFAKLTPAREGLPAGAPARPEPRAAPARAVIRMERKGRGGKEVTVVERLSLQPAAMEQWLREIKQALGCGGVLEADTLVFQGDHRARLKALLQDRGVARVSVG